MFQGEYRNSMDAKGRVNVPAAFRDALRRFYGEERIVVTRDYDGCLAAYPVREWERDVLGTVRKLDLNDGYRRAYERFVVSPAVTCEPDRQGRILLPATLREYAGLDRTVLFAGGVGHFEIWDQARREECMARDLALLRQGPPRA